MTRSEKVRVTNVTTSREAAEARNIAAVNSLQDTAGIQYTEDDKMLTHMNTDKADKNDDEENEKKVKINNMIKNESKYKTNTMKTMNKNKKKLKLNQNPKLKLHQ